MTLAWAVVIVAVLYLLDKHRLLNKSLKVTAVAAAVLTGGGAVAYYYPRLMDRWEDHKLAKRYECFNSSTGKVHSVNESGQWCEWGEEVHARGTPLPLAQGTQADRAARPPMVFGNASCSGQQYMTDYRDVNTTLYGDKHCRLVSNDPGFKGDDHLEWGVVRDGERLNVLGRSVALDGLDHGDAWYRVTTQDGHEGYMPDEGIKCDGVSESCKCGGEIAFCPKGRLVD